MKLLQSIQFPGCIQALYVSENGKQIAAVSATDGMLYGSADQTKCDPEAIVITCSAGKLKTVSSVACPMHAEGRKKSLLSANTCVRWRDKKTVVWARLGRKDIADEFVEVLVIDLDKKQVAARHVLPDGLPNFMTGLSVTPRYAFVGTQNAVICLNAKTLQEICRTEEFKDNFEPLQDDLMGEESLAVGGFVWDENTKRLYTLMGYYNAGVIFCYALNTRAQ